MPVRSEENLSAPPTHQDSADKRYRGSIRRVGKALWIGVALLAVLLIVGGTVLAARWPFTRAALIGSLEQDAQGQVEMGAVHDTYFPHPGCVAENVVIHREVPSPQLTIRRLTIQGSYLGMLHRHIPRVIAEGAVLTVPSGELKELFASGSTGQQPTGTSVGEIEADGAQIVVATEDNNHPLTFAFHELRVRDVSKDSAVGFVASLQTPEPTGDLQLQGKIGPFRRDQAGSTPLSGTYSYKNAKLEEFIGVGGVLSSDGKFNGQLQAISVDGTTDTPDFQLDVGVHPVHLKTKFHALVNGTTGDLSLDPVESSWGKTTLITRGTIEGPSDAKKLKTIALDMTCTSGRVQDLLQMFVHDDQPPMSGAITFQAHVVLPPEPDHFLRQVRLQGEFAIDGGRYASHATQQDVEILSARARGQADKIEDDQDRDKRNGTNTASRDLQPVVSKVKSQVVLRDGVAHFSDLSFDIPGAAALLNGTYDLRSRAIDMRGPVHLESKLSEATTGVKSFVLKVVGPLTPHHGDRGSTVEVHVTGTYGHPSFAVQPMKGGP
jgi:hypothetical protein